MDLHKTTISLVDEMVFLVQSIIKETTVKKVKLIRIVVEFLFDFSIKLRPFKTASSYLTYHLVEIKTIIVIFFVKRSSDVL